MKPSEAIHNPWPPMPAFRPIANPDAVVISGNVRFTVLADRLIRIEYSRVGQFEDHPSQAFWYRDQPIPTFRKKITDTSVEIETEALHLFYLVRPAGPNRKTLSIVLKQTGRTWQYGDRQKDNLKGTARTLDGATGTARLEDGLLSRSGWAVVDDSRTLVFNLSGWLEPRQRRQPDLYFFGYGTDQIACLGDFTRLAGPIPMIPRFILGNWWSRFWPYRQEELQALMEDFRAHEIPLSVCIVDMDWHITKTGNKSDGWTGYSWNRKLFPAPQDFIRWLHAQGLRTALNLHPALGVYPHEQQYEAMANWMGVDPATRQPIRFDIADPHFMEGYFKILHHPYESLDPVNAEEQVTPGIDFWWMDWQQGRKSRMPGLDPLWMLNHLHFHDLGRDGCKRPFVFSRWGGLGNHRYPIGFSGDTFLRWSALAFQPRFTATAANVAYGWWSHDIGGHMFKDQTPELYLRWVQFGIFSPIFRLHSTSRVGIDHRPWSKPERYYEAAREAMQLRHALIPYIYSMAWRAHRTGISLIAPMYYGNMQDPEAFKAKDQYFFGSDLLVAPILEPVHSLTGLATKRVWFPAGTWFNFFNGERVEGEQWYTVQAALEDIPVSAQAGAIIPLAPRPSWGGIDNPPELDIYLFPGSNHTFELYEDDGETTDYLHGCYAITRLELTCSAPGVTGGENTLTFTIHPAEGDLDVIPSTRTVHIHLRGVEASTVASIPGIYDSPTRTLNLEPIQYSSRQAISISFQKRLI
jgi:alpha-glucosidase (family GH31 glycosyl hydrolase)